RQPVIPRVRPVLLDLPLGAVVLDITPGHVLEEGLAVGAPATKEPEQMLLQRAPDVRIEVIVQVVRHGVDGGRAPVASPVPPCGEIVDLYAVDNQSALRQLSTHLCLVAGVLEDLVDSRCIDKRV